MAAGRFPRLPRITRLMALAIRFEEMIHAGIATDYADLARLGGVTRARMTQVMNLLNLAPDIQEEILFFPRTLVGRDSITERALRQVSCRADWTGQRQFWSRLVATAARSRGHASDFEVVDAAETPGDSSPEDWQAAIDAGADGVQTDRPGPLVEYLRRKGFK
jgi:hypothetical protein